MGVVIKGKINPDVVEVKPLKYLRYDENVIKRERINYSIPQKVRFGMLPYSALEEYQKEKEAAKSQTKEETQPHNHTFWEDENYEQKRMSPKEFEEFLKNNAINL